MGDPFRRRSTRTLAGSRVQSVAAVVLPFAVSLAPLSYLWSVSSGKVPLTDVMPLVALLMVATAAAILVLAAATRDLGRSAVTVAIAWLPMLTFGYQRDALGSERQWWHYPLLLVINAVVAGVLLVAAWRRDVRRPAALTAMASIVFIASTLPGIAPGIARAEAPNLRGPLGSGDGPDVYFIVLDAYGREDVLREMYGHDNASFLDGLRERGFYVADESYSNYAMTSQSLAATMTMRYLPGSATRDQWHAGNMVRLAPTISTFRQHGYRYVHFESEAWVTADAPQADLVYRLDGLSSEFQRAFLGTTLPGRLWLSPPRHEVVLKTLRDLREVPTIEGPTFTLAHIISPHPPFMFDETGVLSSYDDNIAGAYDREAYAAQISYLNAQITHLIDDLIEQSDELPIIILQGDHGPALAIDLEVDERTVEWERMAILNAMLVPESARRELYPSVSPVNTFRVLIGDLFEEDLPTLPDRSFYSWYDEGSRAAVDGDPAKVREVTKTLPRLTGIDGS